MPTDNDIGRLEATVPPEVKEKYRRHALATYGMKLATWLKMLAHRDYTSHNDE